MLNEFIKAQIIDNKFDYSLLTVAFQAAYDSMSFGFLPSDIVLFFGFATKVIKALKDEGGSRSEYRLAERQCQDFITVMGDAQRFDFSNLPLSSRIKLEEHLTHTEEFVNEFKRSINKYEESMGKASRRGLLTSAPRKIQWAISAANDLDKFRQSLSAQLSIVQLTISKTILSIVAGSGLPQRSLPGPVHDNALSVETYRPGHARGDLDWNYYQIENSEIFNRINDITDLVFERILARHGSQLASRKKVYTLPDGANASASYPQIDRKLKCQSLPHADNSYGSSLLSQSQAESTNGQLRSEYHHTLAGEINEYLHSLNLEELSEQEAEQLNNTKTNPQLNDPQDWSSETIPQEDKSNRDQPWSTPPILYARMSSIEFMIKYADFMVKILQSVDSAAKTSFMISSKKGLPKEFVLLSNRVLRHTTLLQIISEIICKSAADGQQQLVWKIIEGIQEILCAVEAILAKARRLVMLGYWPTFWWAIKKQVLLMMEEVDSLNSMLSMVLQAMQIQVSERCFTGITGARELQTCVVSRQ